MDCIGAETLTIAAWEPPPWRAEQMLFPTPMSTASVEVLLKPLAARFALTALTNFACPAVSVAVGDDVTCAGEDLLEAWLAAAPVVFGEPSAEAIEPMTNSAKIPPRTPSVIFSPRRRLRGCG